LRVVVLAEVGMEVAAVQAVIAVPYLVNLPAAAQVQKPHQHLA